MAKYAPRAAIKLRFLLNGSFVNSMAIYVKKARVEHKMYREAAEASVTIDLQYFPFDPRVVISPIIYIYMADVDYDQEFVCDENHVAFIGYVEQINLRADRVEVEFKCKDYTCLFLNTQATFGLPSAGMKITDVFKQIINLIPAASTLSSNVKYVSSKPEPVITRALSDLKQTVNLDKYKPKNANAWEFLQNMCIAVGLICYVHFDTIYIDDPHNFRMDKANDAYCFGYPFNTSKIDLDRKNGKYKNLQVEIRSTQNKQVLVGRYPATPQQSVLLQASKITQNPLTQGGQVGGQVGKVVQVVSGNYNIQTLNDMARLVYNELKAYESEVTITSSEMLCFTENSMNSSTKIPVFNIKISDNLKIITLWDDFLDTQKLVSAGWDANVADSLVSLSKKSQRLYYVSGITFDFNNTAGFTMTLKGLSMLDDIGQAEPNDH